MSTVILESMDDVPLATVFAGDERLRVGDERRRVQITGTDFEGKVCFVTLPLGVAQSVARAILTHEASRP